jgi:hypothetical protein
MGGVGERSWAEERQIRGIGGDGSWVEGEMDHRYRGGVGSLEEGKMDHR